MPNATGKFAIHPTFRNELMVHQQYSRPKLGSLGFYCAILSLILFVVGMATWIVGGEHKFVLGWALFGAMCFVGAVVLGTDYRVKLSDVGLACQRQGLAPNFSFRWDQVRQWHFYFHTDSECELLILEFQISVPGKEKHEIRKFQPFELEYPGTEHMVDALRHYVPEKELDPECTDENLRRLTKM